MADSDHISLSPSFLIFSYREQCRLYINPCPVTAVYHFFFSIQVSQETTLYQGMLHTVVSKTCFSFQVNYFHFQGKQSQVKISPQLKMACQFQLSKFDSIFSGILGVYIIKIAYLCCASFCIRLLHQVNCGANIDSQTDVR